MRLLRNARGQSLIEYVILVALVGVATMGMVRVLQSTVRVNLGRVVNSLQGNATRPAFETIDADSAKRKLDFSDFMNGASARDKE